MKASFTPSYGMLLACSVSAFILSGCLSLTTYFTVRTEVQKDGSIDRILVGRDSVSPWTFGTAENTEWVREARKRNDTIIGYSYTYRNHFNSIEEAAALTPLQQNAVYRVKSRVETRYRWFYTTTRFVDTYLAVIRFEGVSLDEYFNSDDIALTDSTFIGYREDNKDTVRGKALKDKMDKYIFRGIIEALMGKTLELMKVHQVEKRWMDTLTANRERLLELGSAPTTNDGDMITFLTDTLRLPISGFVHKVEDILPEKFYSRIPVFDDVTHSIQLPVSVISSNAGKIDGNTCTWDLTPYFGLKDTDLWVESRSLNYPEIVGTLLALATLLYYANRRRWLTGDDAVI